MRGRSRPDQRPRVSASWRLWHHGGGHGCDTYLGPAAVAAVGVKAIDGLEAVAEIEWADGGGVTVSFVELYPDDAHLEEVWRVIEGLLEPTDKAGAAAVWFARSFATSHVREAVELARPIVSRGPRYAEVVHYLDEQLARRDA